jgi:hypothetical protein
MASSSWKPPFVIWEVGDDPPRIRSGKALIEALPIYRSWSAVEEFE